jgi:hypothetical protein
VRNVLGCASFLIVLRTQRISRSLSLIPQRIPASLAFVSAAAGPAPHSHPARVCSVLHPLSHAGQGILSESLAVGRGVASARSTDAGRRRRPARWTRLYASNRLRSRSSPPDEDRGRSSPRNRRRPARRHRPARRPPPKSFWDPAVCDGNRLCADSFASVGPSAPPGPGFHVRWPPSGPRVSARAIPVSANWRSPPAAAGVPPVSMNFWYRLLRRFEHRWCPTR